MIYHIIRWCLEVTNFLVLYAAGSEPNFDKWNFIFNRWLEVHNFLCEIKPKEEPK